MTESQFKEFVQQVLYLPIDGVSTADEFSRWLLQRTSRFDGFLHACGEITKLRTDYAKERHANYHVDEGL